MAKWQQRRFVTIPTIIGLATMATLPGAYMGFPRDAFLIGIELWCMSELRQTFQEHDDLDADTSVISQSRMLQ